MARANFERARALYPSCDMGLESWLRFFDTGEGSAAIGKMLYDIYDEVKAEEERAAGTHKMGRRAKRQAVSIDELFNVVFPPQYDNEALPVALKRFMGNQSQAQFARKIPVSQPVLSRILSGEYQPNLELIERIADACDIQPWFFPEWRALFLGDLVTNALLQRPHLSITALKRVRATRRKESTS